MKTITIGTRGSVLALKQSDITKSALLAAVPSLDIQIKIIKTEGDINNAPIPLDVVGKGWFTKEIEHALLTHEIDLAVHSLKDLGDTATSGLIISAFISREDPRDVLVTTNDIPFEELPHGAIIGTDSIRRQVQIQALRPDLVVKSVRGNVLTRLEKLATHDYDALVLASAGLKRLDLESRIAHYFDFTEITPAPGQGTLALQTREEDSAVRALLEQINDESASHTALVERSFSQAVGGGCKAPVGAYAYKNGEDCTLIGMLLNSQGHIVREEMTKKWDVSTDLGSLLAQKLLQR